MVSHILLHCFLMNKRLLLVFLKQKYSLAGSCLRLCDSVKNVMKMTGKSAEEILKCVTENPAKYIGVDDKKGFIKTGFDAAINIFDEDFTLVCTYIKGEKV